MKENNTPPKDTPIADLCRRLARLPRDFKQQIVEALKRERIEDIANRLWKAGYCFPTADLYEFRKTLFPPNSLVDPYTAGPPVLRPELADNRGVAEIPDPPAATQPCSVGCPQPTAPADPPLDEAVPHLIQRPHQRTDALTLAPHAENFLVPIQQSTDPSPSVNSVPSVVLSVNPSVLLTDLRDVINRYVVLPDMAAEALALWIVHTYAFTLRQVTTYIGVVSPEKRCGKTTLLELLGSLAHEAVAAANISPSALFRVIEEEEPTLIIDEADTFLQGRDEMAGILNAGYRKGNAYVIRVAEGKGRKERRPKTSGKNVDGLSTTNPEPGTVNHKPALARYSCWCPKVMAAIGRLPETLADRCIVITMQRKMPGEKCERLRDLDPAPYRERCAEFVEQHREAIASARPDIPSTLNDRAADIWEPLFAIADLAGGDWPNIARQAAVKLSGSVDDEITPIGYFLKDLRNWMVLNQTDRILSREIVSLFNPVHNRPWEDLRRGREINEWWLGCQMRALGVRPKMVRVPDGQGRGYLLEDIEAAFRRYVPNGDLPKGLPGDGEAREEGSLTPSPN